MSLLNSVLGVFKTVFLVSRWPHSSREAEDKIASAEKTEKQKGIANGSRYSNRRSYEMDENQMVTSGETKKRKARDDESDHVRKKGRLDQEDDADLCHALNVSRIDDKYEQEEIAWTKAKPDRELMPPPGMPSNRQSAGLGKHRKRDSFDTFETLSENQMRETRSSVGDEYDMESARRRAAAIQLPPNSGTWEAAEQELFFHLSYRGFEPLLQQNWMIDFPTLPLSLFATNQDQIPLIELHRSSEFRAIKALRDLIDTGKVVRDRVLSAGAELRSEPIIERAANKYIKWSLKDVGIARKQCIPVHAIGAMKAYQTTQDTIRELAIKMHRLSSRHRKACNILTSIEREDLASDGQDQGETRPADDLAASEHNLPIIYGLMVCSSLLAVSTLSGHTPPPAFVERAQMTPRRPRHGAVNSNVDVQDTEMNDVNGKPDHNEDLGLRFIASFDFSDATSDVWNAFVIAIVAMMIRKSLLEVYDIPITTMDDHEFDESVLESSLMDDTIDCGMDRYTARYAVRGHDRSRNFQNEIDDEDDPDR